MTVYSLFTTCPHGLKEPLATELQVLGCTSVRSVNDGVSCRDVMEQVYRINLWSHVTNCVSLWPAKGGHRNEHDIYKLAENIDWAVWFASEQTFKVKVEGKRANARNLSFVDLKTKDTLYDALREACGIRPSVDKAHPSVRVHAFAGECEIQTFLDTSGEALSKRDYRQDAGEAPLRGNLAAGLLLLMGYNGAQSLQDPFCDSGTVVIEVVWIAADHVPGLMCRFGLGKLRSLDRGAWEKIRRQAAVWTKPPSAALSGSDNDRRMIHIAQANTQAAETGSWIEWGVCDAQAARPNDEGGIMISNPSYGTHLVEVQTLQALCPQLGAQLKQHCAGWLTDMFTADHNMPKLMHPSSKRRIPLYSGNLDCYLFLMGMVEGSNR